MRLIRREAQVAFSLKAHPTPLAGSPLISFTVATLTVTTRPMRRTMYSSSSSRLGSLVMPLRLSVLTRY
jgi:hypothetical protein